MSLTADFVAFSAVAHPAVVNAGSCSWLFSLCLRPAVVEEGTAVAVVIAWRSFLIDIVVSFVIPASRCVFASLVCSQVSASLSQAE